MSIIEEIDEDHIASPKGNEAVQKLIEVDI